MMFKELISITLVFNLFFAQTPHLSIASLGWRSGNSDKVEVIAEQTEHVDNQAEKSLFNSIKQGNISNISLPHVDFPEKTVLNLKEISEDINNRISDTIRDLENIDIHVPEVDFHDLDLQRIELPDLNIPSIDLSGIRKSLESALIHASELTKKTYEQASEKYDKFDLFSLVISGATAYGEIRQSLNAVPKDFSDLLQEMPIIARRMKYGAGLRPGEAFRSSEDAVKLLQKVPGAVLMETSETKVRNFLKDKDASHIISYKNGGSSQSNNIFWETRKLNRARGGANATQFELARSRLSNGASAIVSNSSTIARLGLKTTSIAVLVDALVEAEIAAIDLANGKITVDDFVKHVQATSLKTAISAAAFYTLMVIAISCFPELIPIFASPALITASQVFLGCRLASPLLRLLPAI